MSKSILPAGTFARLRKPSGEVNWWITQRELVVTSPLTGIIPESGEQVGGDTGYLAVDQANGAGTYRLIFAASQLREVTEPTEPRTLRNDRSGDEVVTTLSDQDAARLFGESRGGKDHWLWYWLHKYATEERERSTKPVNQQAGAIDFLADSFLLAFGYGLKGPMIRCHYRNQRFKFYLSSKGTICLKSGKIDPGTHDPIGDEEFVGCLISGRLSLARVGYYAGQPDRRPERKLTATEAEFMAELAKDPVGFLAKCSKDMDRCCYCSQPLEDPNSKRLGYGPICAGRYGLPWGSQEYTEKAPSFAKVYCDHAHGLMTGVRENPRDESSWAILSDWLEEHGLKRCEVPERGMTLPRNN